MWKSRSSTHTHGVARATPSFFVVSILHYRNQQRAYSVDYSTLDYGDRTIFCILSAFVNNFAQPLRIVCA